MAKRIIALANAVGQAINADVNARQHLRVVFVPNYSVSLAELIVPATDVSSKSRLPAPKRRAPAT